MALNAAVVLVFGALLAFTFVGRSYLERAARDFAVTKTLQYSAPVVDAAASALESDLSRLLTEAQRSSAEREIASYRADPGRYIGDLAGSSKGAAPSFLNKQIPVGFAGWKERIREHYERILARLLWDLRIFSGSNLVAALLALDFAMRGRPVSRFRLLVFQRCCWPRLSIAPSITWTGFRSSPFYSIGTSAGGIPHCWPSAFWICFAGLERREFSRSRPGSPWVKLLPLHGAPDFDVPHESPGLLPRRNRCAGAGRAD